MAAVEASGRDILIIVVMKEVSSASIIPAEFEAGINAILLGYGVAE